MGCQAWGVSEALQVIILQLGSRGLSCRVHFDLAPVLTTSSKHLRLLSEVSRASAAQGPVAGVCDRQAWGKAGAVRWPWRLCPSWASGALPWEVLAVRILLKRSVCAQALGSFGSSHHRMMLLPALHSPQRWCSAPGHPEFLGGLLHQGTPQPKEVSG